MERRTNSGAKSCTFLHLYLKAGHAKTFRELERKWPTAVECYRELYNLNERFGVPYW